MRKIHCKYRKSTPKIEQKVESTFLHSSLILWKLIGGEWVGKRVVQTNTLRNVWLEDVQPHEDIKNWWHGQEADYGELITESSQMAL